MGEKIVKLLLSASTLPPGPILVITYKNHELDSFLESCLELLGGPGKLVRVGSRSNSDKLLAHNLHCLVGAGGRDTFTGDYMDNKRRLEVGLPAFITWSSFVHCVQYAEPDAFSVNIEDIFSVRKVDNCSVLVIEEPGSCL